MDQKLKELYDNRHFREAKLLIDTLNEEMLSRQERYMLDSITDYMERYQLEYPYAADQFLEQLNERGVEVNDHLLLQWEKAGWLENIIIDGEKRYFKNAVRNLLLLNDSLREVTGVGGLNDSGLNRFCILARLHKTFYGRKAASSGFHPGNMLIGRFHHHTRNAALRDGASVLLLD